jgi:hypothetical protein
MVIFWTGVGVGTVSTLLVGLFLSAARGAWADRPSRRSLTYRGKLWEDRGDDR